MIHKMRKSEGTMRSRNKDGGTSSGLERRLETFADQQNMMGKGALSLALVLTRQAAAREMPLDPNDFLTRQGGQVAGMGKSAVQSILRDHGIYRVLAEEAGRTSRGSIAKMRAYLDLLNEVNDQAFLDFRRIEEWWIARVKEYFASQPFKLKLDPSKSLRHAVHELLDAAFKRQKEVPGMMVAGALMQHMVGAKLDIMAASVSIVHRGFSVADSPGGYKGDFLIHDAAIHVTTAPTEALIRKCQENLEQGLRPVIITTERGVGGATALAQNAGVAERIDILEVEQFVATNVYEKSGFSDSKRTVTVTELVKRYNRIIDNCESDPSLKILVGV
jgi:hypothetical protein